MSIISMPVKCCLVILFPYLAFGLTACSIKSATPVPQEIATSFNATLAPTVVNITAENQASPSTIESSQISLTPTPLIVNNDVTFTVIAQEGGKINALAVNKSTAYIGVGPRLVALDITDPVKPQLIAHSHILPGIVQAILIDNNVAYVAAGSEVVTLDVTDSNNNSYLTIINRVRILGSQVTHLLLDKNTLYAGGKEDISLFTGFVASLKISQNTLELIDMSSLPAPVTALALNNLNEADIVLYIGVNYVEGPRLYTLSPDPTSKLDSLQPVPDTTYDIYSLLLVGETLLVGGLSSITAYDTHQPVVPRQIWQTDKASNDLLGVVAGIVFANDTIYATGLYAQGDYVPFLLALSPPEVVLGQMSEFASSSMILAENQLFVVESGSLKIFDITQPGQLTQTSIYKPFLPSIREATIELNAEGNEILYLYNDDLLEPSACVCSFYLPDLEPLDEFVIEPVTATASFESVPWLDFAPNKNQVYLAEANGLYKANVSNQNANYALSYYPFDRFSIHPKDLVIQDDTIYLGGVSGFAPKLVVAKLTADNVQKVDQLEILDGQDIQAMSGFGKAIYLTTSASSSQGWLYVVDVSQENINLTSRLSLPGVPAPTLATEKHLVATAIADQVFLIDVSRADQPTISSIITLPKPLDLVPFVSALAFQENFLYAVGGNQLVAIDVSEPMTSRVVGTFDLPFAIPFSAVTLVVSAENIVVGNNTMGLYVLQASH